MYIHLKKILLVFIIGGWNVHVLAKNVKEEARVSLAENGKAKLVISVPDNPTVTQQFAASELAKYLHQISGASFQKESRIEQAAIKLQLKKGKPDEGYEIWVKGNDIILSGNSDRALLYAVYNFLERLGCVWLAPDFPMYNGKHEVVPHNSNLVFLLKKSIKAQPSFAYRKIDVDGGRSHNSDNLKKMVDWMAKVRYNVLRVPVNLNGNGRVRWDKWRDDVLPELKKREMILEVGGHGYQNFINAEMEDGTLFKTHPEWFGKDSSCQPSASERLVFNTADSAAVNYAIANIIKYIQQHPEIKIFGLWPSDVGRWQDCKEMEKYGVPQDRQAAFANKVEAEIHKVRPDIILELIAYSFTLSVPLKVPLSKTIQVDFCPINQSFEKQIYDKSSVRNNEYAEELKKWRKIFSGDIGLYSYYRKYAWRSAPVVIPHYIQNDMQWYAGFPLQGISTYAEPGDWFTYELNHYVLAQVSWNPKVDVDSLRQLFFAGRYGANHRLAQEAYNALEQITPLYGSIPFTSLKSKNEINKANKKVEEQISFIEVVQKKENDKTVSRNHERLLLMLKYLNMDLSIQSSLAEKKSKDLAIEQIKDLLAFLQANLDKGVFILTGDNDLARFTKKYGLTNQSLLD
ncbi:MAG: DUF4838 domain-containing protein [Bacteroidota bacterium]|nr:DUF4838 domain-containing protein [Bacteroidota bacterium]